MRYFLFLCLLGCFACDTPEAPAELNTEAEIAKIEANIKAFSGYLMAGDVDAVINAYTPNGKIFANGRDIESGPEALRNYWTPRPGGGITYHKVTPVSIEVVGDTAYDHGYYSGRSKKPDGTESDTWKGKYVIVWKKIAGEWKMELDIWNSVQ